MASPNGRFGLAELLPRYLFANALIEGKRALEVGAVAATEGLSAHHLAKHAKSVIAHDTDREALIRAEKTLGSQKLQFRDDLRPLAAGSFDVVLVADLGTYVADPKLLNAVLRLLANGGHLIAGLRNPRGLALSGAGKPVTKESPARDKVLALLQPNFKSIEWVLQRAAVGYEMIIDTADHVKVDESVAGTQEAGYWVIVAGDRAARLKGRVMVPLSAEVAEAAVARMPAPSFDSDEVRKLKAELHEARIELVDRQAEVHQLSQQLDKIGDSATRVAKGQSGGHDFAALLESAHTQLKRAAEELTKARNENAAAKEQARAANEKLDQALARVRHLETQLDPAMQELDARAAKIDELTQRLNQAGENNDARIDEVAREKKALQVEIEIQQAKVEEITAHMKAMEAQRAAERAAAESEHIKMMELEDQVGRATGIVEDERQKQRELLQQISRLEAVLAEREARVTELENAMKTSATSIAEKTRRLHDLEVEVQNAQAKDKVSAETVERERARFVELSRQHANAIAQLEAERARGRELEATAQAARDQHDSVARQFEGLMRELNTTLSDKADIEKQLANEKNERARLERALTAAASRAQPGGRK